jgi:hypothetical protein
METPTMIWAEVWEETGFDPSLTTNDDLNYIHTGPGENLRED